MSIIESGRLESRVDAEGTGPTACASKTYGQSTVRSRVRGVRTTCLLECEQNVVVVFRRHWHSLRAGARSAESHRPPPRRRSVCAGAPRLVRRFVRLHDVACDTSAGRDLKPVGYSPFANLCVLRDPGEGFQYRYDGSWTFAGGALSHVSTAPYSSGGRITGTGQTITVVFAAATIVNFWTWDGGTGTGQYAVDGGSAVSFSNGTGNTSLETWTKHTIDGLSSGTSHTVVFSVTSTANLYISSVEGRIGDRGVQVNRIGRPGNTSNNLVGKDSGIAGNASGMSRVTKAWDLIHDADLYIIALGTNDYGRQNSRNTLVEAQPGTSPAEYRANLQQMVDLFASRGKCTLLVGEPRTPNIVSPMTWDQQLYWDAMRSIAETTDHCAFVDIGEVWGSAFQGLDLGLYPTSATVHPSRADHGSMAQIVHRVLSAPFGISS